jgi:hypothetical protein
MFLLLFFVMIAMEERIIFLKDMLSLANLLGKVEILIGAVF